MLRASLAFFVIGLLAIALGANNVAGLSIELGKILLFFFLALAVLSLLVSLVSGRRSRVLGLAVMLTGGLLGGAALNVTHADENLGEKVEGAVGDAKTDAKQETRKAKRKARNKSGKGSITKDAGDVANDVADEVGNAADKAKNKVD